MTLFNLEECEAKRRDEGDKPNLKQRMKLDDEMKP